MSYSWDPVGVLGPAGGDRSGASFVPALPPAAGTSSGTLTVRGGVNGIAYSLEELDQAAARVQLIAQDLCRLSAALAAVTTDLWQLPAVAQVAATAARLAGGSAQLATGTLGTRLLDLAAGVRTARATYQQSELMALAAVAARQRLELTGLRLVGGAAATLPVAGPLGGVTAGLVGTGLAGWLAALAVRSQTVGYRDAVQDELATLPRLIDPTDPPLVLPALDVLLRESGDGTGALGWITLAAVAAGRRGGVITPGTLTVAAVGAPTTEPATPASLTSLIADLRTATEQSRAGSDGVPRSTVTVRRFDGGTNPVWEVDIPGTTGWALTDGPGLFDLEGNAEAMTAMDDAGSTVRPTQVGALVTAALAAAGAPRGARVILAGHSQGGIHATALAADPAFRRRYDVRQVLTAGAPIAGFTVPASTAVLSLEHRDDIVPALDGRANPDARNRVTVTGATPTGAVGPQQTVAAAHRLSTYQQMAASADRSTEGSLRDQRESLRDLTRGVNRQTVWVFEGRDLPPSRGAPPSSDAPPGRDLPPSRGAPPSRPLAH